MYRDNVTVGRFCREFKKMVYDNYDDHRLKAIDICQIIGIHERQYYRLAKSGLRVSPAVYLNQFRIEKAIGLIEAGELVSVVARKVGFNSYAYFARKFREEVGCSATDYLKHSKKKKFGMIR